METIEKIKVHDHLCLIYETREEQFNAIIPYIKKGLENREKCVYIADDNTAGEVAAALKAAGIKVDAHLKSGALAIITKQEAYLKQGYFDPEWMIGFLEKAVSTAKNEGYPALRVTGEMTWVFGGDPGVEKLIEYEAKLNYFCPANDVFVVCQYNKNLFSSETLINVVKTHPVVIYGNLVCRNFYYVPPDEFLKSEEEHADSELRRLLANITERESIEYELTVTKKRLLEQLKDFQNFADASTDINISFSEENIFDLLCRTMLSRFGFDMLWLGIAGKDKEFYSPVSGESSEYTEEIIRFVWGYAFDKITGSMLRVNEEMIKGLKIPYENIFYIDQGSIFITNDVSCHTVYPKWRDEALALGYKAAMIVPLVSTKGDVTGMFHMYSKTAGFFTEHKVNILKTFANVSAGLIELKLNIGELENSIIINRRIVYELQKIKALLDETQALAKVGGWEYDVKSRKLIWTDEVYNIYGVAPDEYDPNNINQDIEFYAPEDRLKIEQAFWNAVHEGRPYDLELKFHDARGKELWVRTIGKPELKDGKVIRVSGNIMDVTWHKQAEEKEKEAYRKEVLLKEIHHRVKNNLQIVSSILYLQSEYITDEKISDMFMETKRRIEAMSLIHEKLYRSKDIELIGVKEYLEDMTSGIFDSFGLKAANIKLDIDIADIFFKTETLVPLGLIFNELVSNCVKHAFPESRGGEIRITLKEDKETGDYTPLHPSQEGTLKSPPLTGGDKGEGVYILTVSDNGVGFPEGLDFRSTTTLGLRLVNALTEQLGGTIELERNKGTTFRIVFKI